MISSRAVFASLLFLPIVGCATILDFQDATEMPLTTTEDPSAPSGSSSSSSGASDGGGSSSSPPPSLEEEASTPPSSSSSSGGEEQDANKVSGPSCACVVAPPEGWVGPLALYEGPPNIAPPSCSGRYSVLVHTGAKDPVAPDATCGCTCSAPTGATCGAPEVTFFKDKACTNTCTSSTPLPSGVCTRSTPPAASNCNEGDVKGFAISASAATGGSCTPNATTNVEPAHFGGIARLCALPTDADGGSIETSTEEKLACSGGTICAPPPPNKLFASDNRCVLRSGSFMCPAGYPIKRSLYDAAKATDTRSCSACTCGSASGSCSVDLRTFVGNNVCTSTPSTTSTPVTCETYSPQTRFIPAEPQYSGSCPPSGGTPVGSFVPGDVTTVCCEQ